MNVSTPLGPSARSTLPTLRVQTVVYESPFARVERSLEYLNAAARNATTAGAVESVLVQYGDCSREPTFDDMRLEKVRRANPDLAEISYDFFDANLGSAAGHNRLLTGARSELTIIMNPDVLVFPNAFIELISGLRKDGIGLVEARQTPVEHPKDYDVSTGETSWASTACVLGQTSLFHQLGGFDADSFFLYCDDVDFSWRVRLAGHKIIHQDSAMVFHDKRLNHQGGWIASEAEKYYSAEAAMILTYKYSRPDLTQKYIREFKATLSEPHLKAASVVEDRMRVGRMPEPIDPMHRVGEFVEGAYAAHRFGAQ